MSSIYLKYLFILLPKVVSRTEITDYRVIKLLFFLFQDQGCSITSFTTHPVTCKIIEQPYVDHLEEIDETKTASTSVQCTPAKNIPNQMSAAAGIKLQQGVVHQDLPAAAVQDYLIPYPAVEGRPVTVLSQFSNTQVRYFSYLKPIILISLEKGIASRRK